MKQISDMTLTAHLQGLSQAKQTSPAQLGDQFASMLKETIGDVNQAQLESNRAAEQLATGEAKNLHEVMIKLEEADISLRLLVQMRNKVVEAYQEIMRMQV